ncbi:permeases of the major facilitator superfamily [Bacillus sp. OxB-1]|uniref:MFS transporter n=1 Tax=Bacillus sp. (strain OxB-1) TaxID=98228 RepID=UPI0005823284|nr:MFS transporter [Bacillus sp. OxB-1]BAQ09331.1 permeases of the major facilitator superfamily [Bacillus sp. OxB-1]
MNSGALWTKAFIFVSLSNFFLFITYYSLLITLPSAAISHFGASGTEAGLFTAVFLGAAIIIRPFLGLWIERVGKRYIFIASLLVFTAASFSYGLFDSIFPLLVIRFVHGLGFGIATAITGAIIADIVPESRKGEGMGYFVMSSNLAMVIGPFIGLTVFGEFSIFVLFWVGAASSLLALILGVVTKLSKEAAVPAVLEAKPKVSVFEKAAMPIALTGAFFALAYSTILSFMAVFAMERGLEDEASYFFAVFAVVLILSRPFTGRWFDQYGANIIIFPSILLFGCGMLSLGLSYSALLFFVAAGLIGLGWGTLFPLFQTLAIQSVEPSRRPVAMATFLSIFDIGIGGGSLLAGTLAGTMELGTLYVFSAFYIFLGTAVYYWAYKKGQRARLVEGVQ